MVHSLCWFASFFISLLLSRVFSYGFVCGKISDSLYAWEYIVCLFQYFKYTTPLFASSGAVERFDVHLTYLFVGDLLFFFIQFYNFNTVFVILKFHYHWNVIPLNFCGFYFHPLDCKYFANVCRVVTHSS